MTLARDYNRDGMEISYTSAVLFRRGAVVADIRLTRVIDPPSLVMAKELAAVQAACLAGDDCRDARQAPDSLNSVQTSEAAATSTSAQI